MINKQIIELIKTKDCPKCGKKVSHVNALRTKAEMYLIFCLECNYVEDVYLKYKVIKKCL